EVGRVDPGGVVAGDVYVDGGEIGERIGPLPGTAGAVVGPDPTGAVRARVERGASGAIEPGEIAAGRSDGDPVFGAGDLPQLWAAAGGVRRGEHAGAGQAGDRGGLQDVSSGGASGHRNLHVTVGILSAC